MTQDPTDAVRYRKAAEQGDAEAQLFLGYLYYLGAGVAQDLVEAHLWFSLAASKSGGKLQKSAVEALDTLAEMMTRPQIDEADRRARDWKPATAK